MLKFVAQVQRRSALPSTHFEEPHRAKTVWDQAVPPIRRWAALLILAAVVPAGPAQGAAPEDHSAEFKVLALDLARFDGLLARYPEPMHKITLVAYRNLMKTRVDAIEKEFDQAKYDELRYDINLQCQRLANWMAPLNTPPPDEANEHSASFALAEVDPSPANPAEVAAALAMLDHEIKKVEQQVSRLSYTKVTRDAANARLRAVKDRRAALGKNFSKAGWDAIVAEMTAPW